MTKITDMTKNSSGKWFEVVGFVTSDYDETPVMIAKFTSKHEAWWYANEYVKRVAGYVEICVR